MGGRAAPPTISALTVFVYMKVAFLAKVTIPVTQIFSHGFMLLSAVSAWVECANVLITADSERASDHPVVGRSYSETSQDSSLDFANFIIQK